MEYSGLGVYWDVTSHSRTIQKSECIIVCVFFIDLMYEGRRWYKHFIIPNKHDAFAILRQLRVQRRAPADVRERVNIEELRGRALDTLFDKQSAVRRH